MPMSRAVARERAAPKSTSAERGGLVSASFSLLFQSNPAPMLVYDWDSWRILEVNDAALTQYGYSRDEFLRLSLHDIMEPDEAESAFKNRISDARLVKLEPRRHRKADGTI